MQFKSAAVAVSAAVFVAVMGGYGCSSGPAKTDGGTDAKTDTRPPPVDAGGDVKTCPSGLACEQCDVSGFTPSPQSKPVATIGACSPSELSGYATNCAGPNQTQAKCTTWSQGEPDGGTCLPCLFSLSSSSTWSAIVVTNTQTGAGFYNIPGCLDLVTNTVNQEKQNGGSGTCGDALTDAFGCDDYACGTCQSPDDTMCFQSSQKNECKSYWAPIDSASGVCAPVNGDAAPPKVANCILQSGATDTDFANFLDIFCGAGPT